MSYDRIVISSGHGKYVRGASGILDEVDEARRMVEHLADELAAREVEVMTYHDDVSTSQNENLNRIVDYHNSQLRDLDVSIHFNAYEQVQGPMGVEVLYVTQSSLAAEVSGAIARASDLIDRGAKKRTDLFWLNNCAMPSILIETCFVDSETDCELYQANFSAICEVIANVLAGEDAEFPSDVSSLHLVGKVSCFGGPDDMGVDEDEGLAFIDDIYDAPHLFLPYQPPNTTGLARRLNPFIHYVACQWDYDRTSKEALLNDVALVRALKTGIALKAFPADWGPSSETGRIADISPGLMDDLGIETDDEVEVVFPWREDVA